MFVEAVGYQLVVVIKVGATLATVVVAGTLDEVLFETQPRVKVPFTIITVIVIGRVHHVLAVRVPVPEIAVAGSTVLHP